MVIENNSLTDSILYLFSAKRWKTEHNILESWEDLLIDTGLSEIHLKNAIKKAITTSGHIDCSKIINWAWEDFEKNKEYHITDNGETKERFCVWCLDKRKFKREAQQKTFYCTICSQFLKEGGQQKIFDKYSIEDLQTRQQWITKIINNPYNFDNLPEKLHNIIKGPE